MERTNQWVREHNVYRWAELLLVDLIRIPAHDGRVPVS
jgi:hypothetical protein